MIETVIPQSVAAQDVLRQILLVWKPWQANDPLRGWKERRRQLVEFRANPRAAHYMFQKAHDFLVQAAPHCAVDLLIYGTVLEATPTELLVKPVQVITKLEDIQNGFYDTVILLYPDPIGLNWQGIEKAIVQIGAARYFVINGRGRTFVWNRKSRRALAWRRWLSRVWLPEMLLAPVIVSLSFFLAFYDGLGNHTDSEYL